MKARSHRQHGQIAVIVALCMVVLLVFVALIVDGTNAYQQRRRCQNAVDSAAIAGAVQMRSKDPNNNNKQVYDVIVNYVTQHIGTPDAFVAQYVDGSKALLYQVTSYGYNSPPPTAAAGVYVYAQNKYSLFFGSLVSGQTKKISSASAMAQAGSLASVGGALPVGVPLKAVQEVGPGVELRLWDDAKLSLDSDQDDKAIGGANGARGWLNYDWDWNLDPNKQAYHNSFNNSSSHLDDYIKGPANGGLAAPTTFAGPVITGEGDPPRISSGTAGDFVEGDTGAKVHDVQLVRNLIGQTVFIPIYDYYYDGNVLNDAFRGVSGYDNAPSGAVVLHIVGYAGFTIDAIKASGSGGKYIQGKFQVKLMDGSASQFLPTVLGDVAQAVQLVK